MCVCVHRDCQTKNEDDLNDLRTHTHTYQLVSASHHITGPTAGLDNKPFVIQLLEDISNYLPHRLQGLEIVLCFVVFLLEAPDLFTELFHSVCVCVYVRTMFVGRYTEGIALFGDARDD